MTSDEGVWFPQYRNRHWNNKRYSCHTLNERTSYLDEQHVLEAASWYTKDGKPQKDSYTQTYAQQKRGVLVDEEELVGYGEYKVKNFIINLTPEYRVRYVCTDLDRASVSWRDRIHVGWISIAKKDGPVVYIETRNMTPSAEVIQQAVADIRKAGISVVLDRIVQKDCVRPLDPNGYPDSEVSE
uniref:PWWP domain-containing protein MUM1 n=1 Tax=Lygus hesperus TaxID=30085 RepID=A0A0A9X2Y1_LYGHE